MALALRQRKKLTVSWQLTHNISDLGDKFVGTVVAGVDLHSFGATSVRLGKVMLLIQLSAHAHTHTHTYSLSGKLLLFTLCDSSHK